MKNLLAIVLVALLATTFTFATDNWSSTNKTGTFTATIYCTPTLTPLTQTQPLGLFFNDGEDNVINATLNWTLTGDPAASYTLTTNVSVVPDLTLTGAWTGDWTGAALGSAIDENMTCSVGHTISYNVTKINAATTATTGLKTWTVTVSVAATI